MRFVRTISMLVLALIFATVPAHAQQTDAETLPAPEVTVERDARALYPAPRAGAVDADAVPELAVSEAAADRAAIRRVLRQDEVREIAGRMGVDLDEAAQGIAALNGGPLQRLSSRARAVNQMLAQPADTITLTATTLIIILLGVIIIILLAS